MVIHIQKAKAGGPLWVRGQLGVCSVIGQPELQNETLSQTNKNSKV